MINIKIEIKGCGGSLVESGLRKSLSKGLGDQKKVLEKSGLEFIFEIK